MLEQLERGVVPGSDLPSRLSATLNELRGSVCVLENLLARENPSTRPMWQTRLYEMKNGLARIQNSFQRINAGSMQHARWKREQAELFGRSRRAGASPGQMSAMAAYADEKESLASSSHMVSQMTELTGTIMVSGLSATGTKLPSRSSPSVLCPCSPVLSVRATRQTQRRAQEGARHRQLAWGLGPSPAHDREARLF